ncbi:MAG TPA: trypsin-like peptidase domain-containing protein [Thermoleophilaceae bacterium]|jgi:S1-C subfamily serine protease|nr:trypsin-like peptidase domain-containing protein [Thermoleophilaceae bacterium]
MALAGAAFALALLGAGCAGSDDEGTTAEARKVTTTRVQVVQGIGREGGFEAGRIYEQLSPGVVTVLSLFGEATSLLEDNGEGGQGSGFVLDDRGYIATNAHVVTAETNDAERAEQVFVEFSDGNRVPAEIVGTDPNADVALLKVDPDGLSLTPLPLGHSGAIDVGQPVAAIGSPFGERQSLSVGVVSAIDRNIQSLTRFGIGNAIQTDAAINPGNSGGPLLDARGRVIGINAQIKSQSGGGEGVGFAIPVDTVSRSLRELREAGKVDYGYLGVSTLILWPQLAERLDIGAKAGALVQEVEAGSPARDAGIEAGDDTISFQGQTNIAAGGDVIVAVDGERLTREDDLSDVISRRGAGDEVELTVVRDGEQRQVKIELEPRPAGSTP